jgi:hypothetical protein
MSDNQLNPRSYRQPVEVTFTFPEKVQAEIGYVSVTVRELKASSEARALARAGNDGAKLITELVKESVVCAVDLDGVSGKISTADESIEIFMDRLGPKGRTALMAAYSNVNQPQQDEIADFLKSAKAVVR